MLGTKPINQRVLSCLMNKCVDVRLGLRGQDHMALRSTGGEGGIRPGG